MSNPNNCKTCGHFDNEPGGHCYMFRYEPVAPCMQHTVRTEAAKARRMLVFRMSKFAMLKAGQP